jgi:ABC-type multidrug transport system ATPase subunit
MAEQEEHPTPDVEANGASKGVKRDIPLVEMIMEHVSYAPMVASAGSSGKAERQRKTILHDISTKVSPYQLTAWMGPSGSGKTSLISVAANLLSSPDDLVKDSMISVNGEEGTIPKRLIGVVWQDDLLLSNLTVEENLFFAARLKTPEKEQTNAQVHEVVAETMAALGLTHVRDQLVGAPLVRRGISGGERKRVAVGAELVARPSVLLLDEITSGLDSTTAQTLMITLKELAHAGHAIVVVIHQPRTAIFSLFDHLLLLSRGHVVFDGPACRARSYLELQHGELPPETGIADWMMDIITLDEKSEHPAMAQQWVEARDTLRDVTSNKDCSKREDRPGVHRMNSLRELHAAPSYNTGFLTQLKLLTHRTLKQQRGERLTMVAVLLQLLYLFFTSLFWWRIPDNTSRIFERNSLLFFILIAQANGIVIAAVTVFQRERVLLARERAKKMYGVASYFLAKTASDLTNNVVLPVLYSMLVYWTAGFRSSGTAYMKYTFAFYWIYSTAQSMGLFLSIAIPNPNLALVLAPPITLFFVILGGFYIPLESMNPGVKWATYLSFARYGYSALM